MHRSNITLTLKNEAETLALGAKIASVIQGGLKIWLRGDLGAGKTTLARGLLRGLGYDGKVKSPTYTLVESYVISGITFYHFDLYRFISEEEWEEAGFREYFNPTSVCLVEWPEKAANLLPHADIEVALAVDGGGRKAALTAQTTQGQQCLDSLA
ncbi:MAG TPA: tRNA (adenosine(37)-N6)-threonylcarbamoyltransferase complex ATPase subunit type 1 TsaE [Methylophilaceae bacterium]